MVGSRDEIGGFVVQRLETEGHDHVAPLDAVDVALLELLERAQEPAVCARILRAVDEGVAGPERVPHRADGVLSPKRFVIRTRERVGPYLVVSRDVGGHRESVEVLEIERALAI